mmetsp:Transcript_34466/g.79561  ORF Transcript_34466/g.79561 Transcript_34466/m.79561 type:complete len:115 (+) Transcript_34466:3-347(+)
MHERSRDTLCFRTGTVGQGDWDVPSSVFPAVSMGAIEHEPICRGLVSPRILEGFAYAEPVSDRVLAQLTKVCHLSTLPRLVAEGEVGEFDLRDGCHPTIVTQMDVLPKTALPRL